MDTVDLLLIIIIPSTIVVGGIMFLLAGIYRVKANQVMVIEKFGSFYNLYKKGTYFFFPNVYRRVGVYTIDKMEKDIHLKNGNHLILTYQVEDVKKYHYSKNDVEKEINEAIDKGIEMNEESLISILKNIGVNYISIRKA